MATHSSALAWRIPGTGEPGGLPSMRSQRVGHDWGDLAAAAAAAAITGKQPKVSGIQFSHLWNGDNDSILTQFLLVLLDPIILENNFWKYYSIVITTSIW